MQRDEYKLIKWDDFKTRRNAVIEKYLALKRKEKQVKDFIGAIKMVKTIKKAR